MVDRFLTGAHYGLKGWLIQRFTSIINLMLSSILLVSFIVFFHHNYQSWHIFFSYTIIKILAQLIVVSFVLQSWINVRDMWMDYIKHPALRIFLHTSTILWLLACLIYSITIIWEI
jgi:succinate dehydrogenase, hydrophobic membrane anchor protein